MATKEQYVVNENGERTAVLLEVEYYQKLLAALEEVESIRAYDEAKASSDEIISFALASEEIEQRRK